MPKKITPDAAEELVENITADETVEIPSASYPLG